MMNTGCWLSRQFAACAALTICTALWAGPVAAGSVFTTGPFKLPEGITAAPGGSYILSDGDTGAVYSIPANGGAPTSTRSLGFGVFGEIALTGFYGAQQGTYLAYGGGPGFSDLALVGSNGLGSPSNVFTAPNSGIGYSDATVAPAAYRGVAAGQIILSNNATPGSIVALNANLAVTTTILSLPGVATFGVGFAPSGFGAKAGDLFVSDGASGDLYTVDSLGKVTLFADLPLPTGLTQPGLRQFVWAPPGFGQYGGDLFVSVAAQNGGGGTTGEIDVLNAAGQAVALYAQGNGAIPLDPRGLEFLNNSTLLAANADPGIDALVPSDFLPAAQVLGIPEPGSFWILGAGLIVLTGTLRGRATLHKLRGHWAGKVGAALRAAKP
jgi:hypothetical protein